MQQLKDELQNYSDEQLIKQLLLHHEEYTPEALVLLKNEVEKRNLDVEKQKDLLSGKNESDLKVIQLDTKDFQQFDHMFNRMDLELAAVILRDNQIPFYADNPKSSNTLPLEAEAERQFSIHVHTSGMEKAHELLDEHFDKVEGRYRLKKMSVREQLKAFSFYELHLSEIEAAEKVEVIFTDQEKEIITRFGRKILEECDQIEKKQDRVLFYFDTIESIIAYLSEGENRSLSKTELLTVLEILQVFCDDSQFPLFMDEVISNLLGFFLSNNYDT